MNTWLKKCVISIENSHIPWTSAKFLVPHLVALQCQDETHELLHHGNPNAQVVSTHDHVMTSRTPGRLVNALTPMMNLSFLNAPDVSATNTGNIRITLGKKESADGRTENIEPRQNENDKNCENSDQRNPCLQYTRILRLATTSSLEDRS